jgi:hypothetical protein
MEGISSIKNNVSEEALASETYERLLPELQALSLDELVNINLDIPSAVMTTLGALPEIRAFRTEILALPNFDGKAFDKLEDYAFALQHAHTLFLMATQPTKELDVLTEEATALRETLLMDASALAHRGHINGNRLNELQGAHGFRNLATDLGLLVGVLREAWPQIQGRSSVQVAELDHAVRVAQRVLRLAGLREQGPEAVASVTDMRMRAFTLFSRTYDDARRAITFLRWSIGDADKICPSLYAGRSNGRRKSPETPVVTQGAPAASPAPGASPGASTQPQTPNANGPRTDPFLS